MDCDPRSSIPPSPGLPRNSSTPSRWEEAIRKKDTTFLMGMFHIQTRRRKNASNLHSAAESVMKQTEYDNGNRRKESGNPARAMPGFRPRALSAEGTMPLVDERLLYPLIERNIPDDAASSLKPSSRENRSFLTVSESAT